MHNNEHKFKTILTFASHLQGSTDKKEYYATSDTRKKDMQPTSDARF